MNRQLRFDISSIATLFGLGYFPWLFISSTPRWAISSLILPLALARATLLPFPENGRRHPHRTSTRSETGLSFLEITPCLVFALRSQFSRLDLGPPAPGIAGKACDDNVPDKINDGWETASPSSVKLDAKPLNAMVERVSNGTYKNIHSVLIVKDDKLVFEQYFPREIGDCREQAIKRVAPQPQYSVTKSVTSILIGIAIDQHLISGVDEKISTFFPEYADLLGKPDKSELRLKDLLTMSAGLSWDEWTHPYADPRNAHALMIRDPDPMRFVLGRPVVAAPGTTFAYNSGASIALGQIISKATSLRVDRFADRFLFEPLGINDYYWMKYPDDIVQTGGGLYLRSRDMAKLGQLFLNNGRWNGKQIVSEAWVKESTTNQLGPVRVPVCRARPRLRISVVVHTVQSRRSQHRVV